MNPRLIDLEDEEGGLTAGELEERIAEAEAKKRAVVLEMIGCVGARLESVGWWCMVDLEGGLASCGGVPMSI